MLMRTDGRLRRLGNGQIARGCCCGACLTGYAEETCLPAGVGGTGMCVTDLVWDWITLDLTTGGWRETLWMPRRMTPDYVFRRVASVGGPSAEDAQFFPYTSHGTAAGEADLYASMDDEKCWQISGPPGVLDAPCNDYAQLWDDMADQIAEYGGTVLCRVCVTLNVRKRRWHNKTHAPPFSAVKVGPYSWYSTASNTQEVIAVRLVRQ